MTELRAVPADRLPTAVVCRWMAGMFLAPPDAAALGAYRGAEGQGLLARLARVTALAPAAAEIAALAAPGADLDEAAGRLAAAHTAAFLVGGRRSAPPYASVWLSERGLLYQAPARDMARLLAAAGLALPADVPEPPDHIAFQLNLLAELEERAADGRDAPLTPEAFVRDHLSPWLPAFAAACAGLRDPLVYAALATGVRDYLSGKK